MQRRKTRSALDLLDLPDRPVRLFHAVQTFSAGLQLCNPAPQIVAVRKGPIAFKWLWFVLLASTARMHRRSFARTMQVPRTGFFACIP